MYHQLNCWLLLTKNTILLSSGKIASKGNGINSQSEKMIFVGFEKTIFGNVKQKGGKLTQSAEAFVQPRHKECVGDTHPLAGAFFNQLLFSLRV